MLMIAPAHAEGEPDCASDTANMSQMEMNFCSYESYQNEDAKLNAIWKKVRAKVKAMDEETDSGKTEAMDALMSSQRGWLAYRDGECIIASFEAYGGSMRPMLVNGCLEEMTKARVKQLSEFLEKEASNL